MFCPHLLRRRSSFFLVNNINTQHSPIKQTPITSQAKEDFKFHAAHFVAFEGYRERLHGHNYRVGVRLLGSRKIASDGYVVDFGDIKRATRTVCKQLNEHFLCPTLSNVLDIKVVTGGQETASEAAKTTAITDTAGGDGPHGTPSCPPNSSSVTITCQDGSVFVFPKTDCAMLPIVHATAEELAIYLWSRILEGLHPGYLLRRGIHTMEVIVAEAVGQEAVFRLGIPNKENGEDDDDDTAGGTTTLDVASFIMGKEVKPAPCPNAPERHQEEEKSVSVVPSVASNMQQPHRSTPDVLPHSTTSNTSSDADAEGSQKCCTSCQDAFFRKLERLATILNDTNISRGVVTTLDGDDTNNNNKERTITAKDLEIMMG
jgi:dihydroneopterin triphosphate aldolase (PTPS-III) / 6-pyruvoyltetrahydropterin synthase